MRIESIEFLRDWGKDNSNRSSLSFSPLPSGDTRLQVYMEWRDSSEFDGNVTYIALTRDEAKALRDYIDRWLKS